MRALEAERRAEARRLSAGQGLPRGEMSVDETVAWLLDDAEHYASWGGRFERWAEAY